MKFRAVSTADVAQTFARIVTALSKQTLENVVMRFTTTHIQFIRPTNEVHVSFRLNCRVKRDQIFNDYKMEGFSREENEMYLQVNIDHLKKAVAHIERSTVMTIKLDGGTADGDPCFLITLETGLLAVASKRKVIHQVPVTVISHRRWPDFAETPIPDSEVSIELRSPKSLSKIVDRLKLMDSAIDLAAIKDLDSVVVVNKTGTFQIMSGRTVGGARVSSDFPNVPMIIHGDVSGENDDDSDDPDRNRMFRSSVEVDVKILQQFLSAFVNINSTLHIDLRKDLYARLSLTQHELDVTLTLPKLNQ